jgi:RNA recognition motif-containing protein
MGRKLYVGNLPFSATEEDISAKFATCGTVESAKLITDRDTGRSKGFGFVEMGSDAEAQAAIDKLNGQDYDGRPMTVNEARPQKKRTGPGGGGGGGGGGRGGYGGGGGGGNRW